MQPDHNSEHLKVTLARWAQSHPEIHAIVLFGSRARGTSRIDSDVDVCVMVDPWDGEKWYTRWRTQADKWKADIASLLDVPQDDLQLCSLTSSKVKQGLEAGCKFLYLREDTFIKQAEKDS